MKTIPTYLIGLGAAVILFSWLIIPALPYVQEDQILGDNPELKTHSSAIIKSLSRGSSIRIGAGTLLGFLIMIPGIVLLAKQTLTQSPQPTSTRPHPTAGRG